MSATIITENSQIFEIKILEIIQINYFHSVFDKCLNTR